jgi:hypothetical protein
LKISIFIFSKISFFIFRKTEISFFEKMKFHFSKSENEIFSVFDFQIFIFENSKFSKSILGRCIKTEVGLRAFTLLALIHRDVATAILFTWLLSDFVYIQSRL